MHILSKRSFLEIAKLRWPSKNNFNTGLERELTKANCSSKIESLASIGGNIALKLKNIERAFEYQKLLDFERFTKFKWSQTVLLIAFQAKAGILLSDLKGRDGVIKSNFLKLSIFFKGVDEVASHWNE